jgi:ribosomal protein L14E/L6E/L27E
MMNEFIVGGFAVSKAGHDSGKCYVIFQMDSEYVYLVDGRIRTIDRPKKKKAMHVQKLDRSNQSLADKIIMKTAKDEEIKRAIKLLQYGNSSKEVE